MKVLQLALWLGAGVIGFIVLGGAGYVLRNLYSFSWEMRAVAAAGFTEKRITLAGAALAYTEGPDNGPPLLLIHGQGSDWKNYARVLPRLAKDFHVFAVDVYGHGASDRMPERYSAAALGESFRTFLTEVVREPAIVSGHSSGGQIAAWLAAYAPGQVSGVVLEDPPLFTTELPRARETWNYADLATACHAFLRDNAQDFASYYLRRARFWTFFGNGAAWFQEQGLAYRASRPDAPPKFWALPPSINELFRTLCDYDPRFGEAFYTGSWQAGFDTAAVLEDIKVPAVLIHTNWQYDADGILMAAMDADDAERARSSLEDVRFYKVNSGHGFHFEKPRDFIRILTDFRARVAN